MAEVSGRRPLRPFPALDPEPPRRLTWRSLRWPAVACLAAAAVAAAFLTWPSSSQSASRLARAPFADRDGLVVFEQQPSGMLGTAAPDGSHPVTLRQVGALQGRDLPVAADDGRHLVNLEGQLVTMGPAGPTSVSDLADSGQDATNQAASAGWADVSFADGGRYVVATACNLVNSVSQSWVADLIPAAGGRGRMLGTVTHAVGDPVSAAAIVSAPASPSAASSAFECFSGESAPDQAVELRQPRHADRTLVTAAELKGALGWPQATPVRLYPDPGPGGSRLALDVTVDTPPGQQVPRQAVVMVSRAGRIVAHMPLPAASSIMQWSPDGQRIAFCQASPRALSRVTVWSVGQVVKTIVLPGHHDVACNQLLWSPDGSQLIYAAWATERGLTQADNLQHGWTVIDLRSGRVHDVTAPGQPAAWLPGTAGESR
ncbi:MAG TPA: hypothetical protein VFX25_12245 [Streptosporangiaceae bacterium]|nr:hypothetical protein [Streptosporangiaceae bacterium]